MESNYFIEDIKSNIGNVTQVRHQNLKFDEYTVVYFQTKKNTKIFGNEYIKGSKAFKKNELNGLINDSTLLFSLINLMKEPIPKGFHRPYLDDIIKTEKIIQWCHVYGIPYEDEEFTKNYSGNGYACGFSASDFRREIAFLFSFFKLWEAITKRDIKNIYEYGFAAYLLPNELDKLKTPDEKILEAKRNLATFLNTKSNTQINLFYDETTDEFRMAPSSNSLISIAYYQLSCFVCTPEWARSGLLEGKRNIKICKNCLEYFLGHGNSEYCGKPECDRRTVHRRKAKIKSKKDGE